MVIPCIAHNAISFSLSIYLSTGDISAAMHIFGLKGELVIPPLLNSTQEKQKALSRRLGFAVMMIKFIRTLSSSSSYNITCPEVQSSFLPGIVQNQLCVTSQYTQMIEIINTVSHTGKPKMDRIRT